MKSNLLEFRHRTAISATTFLLTIALSFVMASNSPSVLGQQTSKRAMTVDDLYKFARVSSPCVSPDGSLVAYQVAHVNADTNETKSNIYIVSIAEGVPRQLTNSGKRDGSPQFSPDGKFLIFESNRSGTNQLWAIALDGGEATQLTDLKTEVSSAVWSRDGKRIAFVSTVFPEFATGTAEEINKHNADKLTTLEESKVKVRVSDHLFHRHWDSYVENKRQHLFVMEIENGDGRLRAGSVPRDVTPGDRDASPTSSTFSSGKDFCFTADGQHLLFTATPSRPGEASFEAWSTNYQICRVSIDNTSSNWETITAANDAADSGPQISPDGKLLAWRAQDIAGAEADRWLINSAAIGPDGVLLGKVQRNKVMDDISVAEFEWCSNSDVIFNTEWQGRSRLYRQRVDSQPNTGHVYLDNMPAVHNFTLTKEGKFIYSAASLTKPAEVYLHRLNSEPTNLSRCNDNLLAELDVPEPDWVMDVNIEDNRKMQVWLMYPPGFDRAKKYPTIYMVHGGPQGAWNDAWSYRWNPALWAAQGYVVALPNPRGSTGFGQEFVEQISGDWGGKCYRDLMAGADYVANLEFVDADRMASAGASFGGYMMNWFAVNTDRFCTLVTHCSVYDFESMWGTTDELWFDEYEHGGMPWQKRDSYREFSPHVKAENLGKFQTPMLVIHNDLDFRCPLGQGIELFTSLQRQNVPSRFVNFPDEGHWVNKAANGRRWHQEVFRWLDQYCKNAK